MQGDTICARCGASEESINHVFFECPPGVQVWALSRISSNTNIFPTQSLFLNMNYLFQRIYPELEDHQFVWILWYIWKEKNNKVFSNLDIYPRDTLKLAETESLLWAESHIPLTWGIEQTRLPVKAIVPAIQGGWCFTDGLEKSGCIFGTRVVQHTGRFDGFMGAMNIRASESPLHSEIETLIWAME